MADFLSSSFPAALIFRLGPPGGGVFWFFWRFHPLMVRGQGQLLWYGHCCRCMVHYIGEKRPGWGMLSLVYKVVLQVHLKKKWEFRPLLSLPCRKIWQTTQLCSILFPSSASPHQNAFLPTTYTQALFYRTELVELVLECGTLYAAFYGLWSIPPHHF